MAAAFSRAITTTVTTLAVLVCLYVASPLAAAYVLNNAIKTGDRATMNVLVDWSAVKSSLRQSILLRLSEQTSARAAPGSWYAKVAYRLTEAVSPMMVDYVLDQRVTPEGFTTYMGPHSPNAEAARAAGIDPETAPGANTLQRIHSAGFKDWTHFQVEIADRWDAGKVFRTTLELRDFIWRLSDVQVLSLGKGA